MKSVNWVVIGVLCLLLSACINPIVSEADFQLTVVARGEAPDLPSPSVEMSPTVDLLPTITPEPCLDIKGNVSKSGEEIYHMQGGANYNNTIAEEYFCSEREAQEAGYRKSQN